MRIAIDISPIVYGTGVSVYTRNLVENLVEIDNKNEYVLYGGSLRRQAEMKLFLNGLKGNNISRKVFPVPPFLADLLWNKLHLFPIEAFIGGIDVFHSSDWTQPPSSAFKVTTIHDLSPLLYPEFTHPDIVKVHKRRLKWVFKECDRIIVPSQTTADDVIKFGYPSSKVRVISEALDPEFRLVNKREIDVVKRKFKIKGRYLLSVGVNKRKNTKRIIEAFNKIKSELGVELVIVGHSQEKLSTTHGVIYAGHVTHDDKLGLFSGAEALVYPSLYEGFGIPILEGFASHVPVVTSNVGAMKELGGESVVLVDPYDSDSIASGILKAIKDRTDLVLGGQKLIGKYSWKIAAQKTVSLYSDVN